MDALTLTLLFLVIYFVSIVIARALRVSVIVAFIAAGALVSAVFPSVRESAHDIELLAEIGIAFLLFEVGSHLPLKKLVAGWRNFFLSGPAQVLVSAVVFYFLLLTLGISTLEAQIIAFALSLSSTALVVQTLKERRETDSPAGEKVISTLVFQDIAAVIGLSVISALALAGNTDGPLTAWQLLSMFGILASILIASWILVRPFFSFVVSLHAEEIITPSALLFVLALSWLAHTLGLSYSIGAFLAGVSIAGTRYSFLVNTELQPFRALLLALFFVSIGSSIDSSFIYREFALITMLTVILCVVKGLANFTAFKATTAPQQPITYPAVLLAQGSEFAFVISTVALHGGLLSATNAQLLQAVTALSLVISPVLGHVGCLLGRSCVRVKDANTPLAEGEIVITEFDEVASKLADALVQAGIPYRGHDRDLERIAYAASRGYKVYFSNMDRPLTISKASLGQARAVVSLIDDEELSDGLVLRLRELAPNVPLMAATRDLKLFQRLTEMGVAPTFIKNAQTAKLLFMELVSKLGNIEEIEKRLEGWTWESSDQAVTTPSV